MVLKNETKDMYNSIKIIICYFNVYKIDNKITNNIMI